MKRVVFLLVVGAFMVAQMLYSQGTWVKVHKPDSTGYTGTVIRVSSQVGYAFGGVAISATTDAGLSWFQLTHSSFAQMSFGQLIGGWADSLGTIVASATPEFSDQAGPIFRSTNYGLSWVQVPNVLAIGTGISRFGYFAGKLFAVGGDFGQDTVRGILLTSTDRGATWQHSSALHQWTGGFWSVKPVSDSVAYICGSQGKIVYTSNGGTVWVDRSVPDNSTGIHDLLIEPNGVLYGQTVATNLNRTKLYMTTNGGLTWEVTFSSTSQDFMYGTAVVKNVLGTYIAGGGNLLAAEVRFRKSGSNDFVTMLHDSTPGGGTNISCKVQLSGSQIWLAGAGDFYRYVAPSAPEIMDTLRDTIRVRNGQAFSFTQKYALPDRMLSAVVSTNVPNLQNTSQPIGFNNFETLNVVSTGVASGFENRDTTYYIRTTVTPDVGDARIRVLTLYVERTADVKELLGVPEVFVLQQNYPNPFNPVTLIRFSVPTRTHVTLKVYDALGQEVATLVDEEMQSGNYQADFTPQTNLGWKGHSSASSGVYFYRLQAGNFVQTRKMLFLK